VNALIERDPAFVTSVSPTHEEVARLLERPAKR